MSKTQQDARDQYTRILTSVPMVTSAPGARDSHLHVVSGGSDGATWRGLILVSI